MEVFLKTYFIAGFLLLATCTSTVLCASLKGSFEQLDNNVASTTDATPMLDTASAHLPEIDGSSILCSTSTNTVTLEPTSSTVYTTFTSTELRVVRKSVVSTETVFASTATVTATPASEALQPSIVASSSVQFAHLSSAFAQIESNDANSTTLFANAAAATNNMAGQLTNIVRRVVTMTVGVLLTPFAVFAQHMSQNANQTASA